MVTLHAMRSTPISLYTSPKTALYHCINFKQQPRAMLAEGATGRTLYDRKDLYKLLNLNVF